MREYIVVLKSDPDKYWYSVDAPSKRIARWCALNMFQNEYCGPGLKPRDFKVYTAKQKAIKDADCTLKEIVNEISGILDFAYESSEDKEEQDYICKLEDKLCNFLRKEGYDI